VAALVVILSSLGGSSKPSVVHGAAKTAASARTHARRTSANGSGRRASSGAGRAADTNVVVLNGTNTNGLAHRIAGELQRSGYSRASALAGRPSGANQTTAVEYASGHRADAEGVARSLGGAQAQPMEAGVESLSGSATVVVIVGLDKAATVP
jgi:LytR cell envelope-related transcriptional attenuator